jgi:hypothetical protein
MKNFYLLLAGLCLTAMTSTAQDLTIDPNPVYVDGITADDFEGVGYAFVNNNTSSNLNLTWQRTVLQITEGWTSAVCDLNQCYFASVGTETFGLGAGQAGTMDVHVYPNGVDGGAIIEIEVFQTNDPGIHTSATYFFNQSSSLVERFSEAVKVYPNPTQDWITIDNTDNTVVTADLLDINGKLVLSSTVNGNQRLSVQELPAGNYILKMMDIEGNIISTNHLVKN